MVSSTTNLLLQKQAAGEFVDEQVEFNGNYDILDPLLVQTNAYQRQYLDFSALNGGRGWLIPTSFAVPTGLLGFNYTANKLYRCKATMLTNGGPGGRFLPGLAFTGNQKFWVQNQNTDRTNLPGVLQIPAWVNGGVQGSPPADTVVVNYIAEGSNAGWTSASSTTGSGGFGVQKSDFASRYQVSPSSQGFITQTYALTDSEVPIVVGDQLFIDVNYNYLVAPAATMSIAIGINFLNSTGGLISASTSSTVTITGSTQNFAFSAGAVPAGTLSVQPFIFLSYGFTIGGTSRDVVLGNWGMFKGTVLPSPGYFSDTSPATPSPGTWDFMQDNVNNKRGVTKLYANNKWALSRLSNYSVGNTLTQLTGTMDPTNGADTAVDPALIVGTSDGPVLLKRERTASNVYLKRLAVTVEEF